jgi:hypothetical protein
MKKLVLAAVLSAFSASSFGTAAHACDGMKSHEKAEGGQTQAKKNDKKQEPKTDQKT